MWGGDLVLVVVVVGGGLGMGLDVESGEVCVCGGGGVRVGWGGSFPPTSTHAITPARFCAKALRGRGLRIEFPIEVTCSRSPCVYSFVAVLWNIA